jgi:hypothetical protein
MNVRGQYSVLFDLAPLRRKVRKAADLALGRVPAQGPNFFIVGATRSGTTYLYDLLRQHPDVFMPENKELNYFNHDARYRPNLRGYYRSFIGYRGERAVGEATPMYMELGTLYNDQNEGEVYRPENVIQRIAQHYPAARLILSLRDPATRIFSIYEKNVGQKKYFTPLAEDLRRELSGSGSELHLIYRNRYDIHLRNIFQHFDKDRVLVLISEEWQRSPFEALDGICGFLQIPHSEIKQGSAKARNTREAYQEVDSRVIQQLSQVPDDLLDEVIRELEPSRNYLEDLLERPLPWRRPRPASIEAAPL